MPIPFQAAEIVSVTEMNELARGHWRKITSKQVLNSVAETDLLNGEISIDAGAMSSNRLLRLTALGDWIQNSGAAAANPRFKLKLGATTLLDSGVIATTVCPASAVRGSWRIVCEIQNTATNVQWVQMSGVLTFGTSSTVVSSVSFVTGEGFAESVMFNTTSAVSIIYQGAGAGAVDTTAAQTLALTVINPTATATCDTTLKSALVEVV